MNMADYCYVKLYKIIYMYIYVGMYIVYVNSLGKENPWNHNVLRPDD